MFPQILQLALKGMSTETLSSISLYNLNQTYSNPCVVLIATLIAVFACITWHNITSGSVALENFELFTLVPSYFERRPLYADK